MLTKTDELKSRIEARRHELLARMAELKADTAKESSAAYDAVKSRLAELEEHLKDGWDSVSDSVKTKLNSWLDKN